MQRGRVLRGFVKRLPKKVAEGMGWRDIASAYTITKSR